MRATFVAMLTGLSLVALPQVAGAQIVPRSPPPPSGARIIIKPVEVPAPTELRDLSDAIEDARDAGQLDRRTARRLRREARLQDSTAERYARDGLSADESRELQSRAIIAREQANLLRGVTFNDPPRR